MERLTAEFAEIIGLLCAEGCYIYRYEDFIEYYKDKIRFHHNHKSERIEFYNKDKKLLIHLQELLYTEFNYRPKITARGKINICKSDIIRKIITQTKLGHLKWKVPDAVLDAQVEIKIAFIRGYFDGDGTVSNRVRMFSTNKTGLIQVSKILEELEIKHSLPKPIIKQNRKPLFYIQISEREKERFLNIIKPSSKI
jgi:intein/homing endonuclease